MRFLEHLFGVARWGRLLAARRAARHRKVLRSSTASLANLERYVAELGVLASESLPALGASRCQLAEEDLKVIAEALEALDLERSKIATMRDRHAAKALDWKKKATSALKTDRVDLADFALLRAKEHEAAGAEYKIAELDFGRDLDRLKESVARMTEVAQVRAAQHDDEV